MWILLMKAISNTDLLSTTIDKLDKKIVALFYQICNFH